MASSWAALQAPYLVEGSLHATSTIQNIPFGSDWASWAQQVNNRAFKREQDPGIW